MEKMKHESKEVSWGWVVAILGGFIMGVATSPMSMFGPLFADVLNDRIETGGLETVVSVYFTSQSFSALMSSTLAKRFGSRTSALVAAFIFCVGNLSSAFCPSFIYLLISYGVVVGLSSGSMTVAIFLNLNDCFTRLRTVAFGLMHSVCISVGMLYPLLMKELMQTYGNSGARLILSAIGANVIPAVLLLRPTLTSRRTFKGTAQTKKLLQEDVPPLICMQKTCTEFRPEPSGKAKISITASWRKYWKVIARSDPAHLLTQPDYVIITLGLTLVTLLDSFFFALLPMFLLNFRSLTLDDTTYILVAVGAGDFAGRLIIMLLGKFLTNSNRIVYLSAAIITATLITVLTFVEDFWAMTTVCCGLGLFRGVIYVTSCLVYSEHYDKELYYAAMGTFGVVAGIVNLFTGYLLGLLRDSSGGYVVKFTVIVGVMFGSSLMWLVDMSLRSCCRRRGYNLASTVLTSKSG